ncbi:MAG: ABC transporter ATP-binding protein [Planctomycetota bacterium]
MNSPLTAPSKRTQTRQRSSPQAAQSASAPLLSIQDLHKSFGSHQALRGISFDLAAGQRLAFLGPNGAGKTTLIRCLSGRTRPDRGTIQMAGGSIDLPGVRDTLGLVPQEIAVYGDLTTSQNLYAFGRFHGLRGSHLRKQVRWALEWTGLQDRRHDLVGQFSGGMKRRVNLACGVLHQPKLLLLDEPTVGVDPQSRQRIFAMLEALSQHGTAILLTTHHLDEAQQQSDRIVIVDSGQIVAAGTFDELVRQTVGRDRVVRLRVDRPIDQVPMIHHLSDRRSPRRVGDQPDAETSFAKVPTFQKEEEQVLTSRIADVASELPLLMQSVRGAGYQIDDVDVQSPSLHHVFLHLTGNALRD